MRTPLLLALLCSLAAPALAQSPPTPLEQLPRGELATTPRDRLFRMVRGLGQAWPALGKVVPPTTGKLRLAVVLVEFADQKRPRWGARAFQRALFSKGSYRRTPTGQRAYGSLRDYFLENSSGRLDVLGKVHDWVRIPGKRKALEGLQATSLRGQRELFQAALDALVAREGEGALEQADALAFVVAGRQAKARGKLLWPHSSLVLYRGKAFRYYLMHSGEARFHPIGTHCHELGHVLGILDKYGLGSGAGLGQWCLMASGGHGARPRGPSLKATPRRVRDVAQDWILGQLEALAQRDRAATKARKARASRKPRPKGARRPRKQGPNPLRPERPTGSALPLHLCAVCKVRLGWAKPALISGAKAQRVRLLPLEGDATQVLALPLDPRGREHLVLAYRARRGFDRRLPQGGLLAWRVGSPRAFLKTLVPYERVELIPGHGAEGLDAPRKAPGLIPFPSQERSSFQVSGTRRGAYTIRVSEVRRTRQGLTLRVQRVAK